MEIAVILPENYLQHHVVHIRKEIFSISFISKEYISWQAPCQIVADRSMRFGQLISSSLDHDFHSDFIYRAQHTIISAIYFFPNPRHPVELWTFQL
jgi:hypothetical protein